MLTLGLINLAIAGYADFAVWAWFVSVGLAGTKIGAFALQYLVFRAVVRRRLRRLPGLGETAPARPAE
jgi:hypothetical protein